MKFKIPEIKIPKLGKKNTAAHNENIPNENIPNEDIPDEDVSYNEYDAAAEEQKAPEQEDTGAPREAQGSGLVISEAQLRMIWAGEIVFALTMVVASFIIAFTN